MAAKVPRVTDLVHYRSLLPDMPGCRAAMVTEIHYDPQLASLVVFNPAGLQFVASAEHSERSHPWEEYAPGTWHDADHL